MRKILKIKIFVFPINVQNRRINTIINEACWRKETQYPKGNRERIVERPENEKIGRRRKDRKEK